VDHKSHKIAGFTKTGEFNAVGFDARAGFYGKAEKFPESLTGYISNMRVTVVCGLGKVGLNQSGAQFEMGSPNQTCTKIPKAQF